jgi:F-type H+-transporting ATPase subunit alpha
MERAFKLSQALGGGSITALPIVETQRGNFAGFIPSNLISMTDGQVFLDSALAAQGQLPAVDIGRSVSRVGASAQPCAMREAAANLRLELAQYADVKGFARFGALLDDTTRRQLEHGLRLSVLLRQPERRPVPMAVQVAELWALKAGLLDSHSPDELIALEDRLLATTSGMAHLTSAINSSDRIDDKLAPEVLRWVQATLA